MRRIFTPFMTAAFVVCMSVASFAEGRVFGASFMNMDSPYFAAMENTIRSLIEYNDDTLITLDPERNQDKQNFQLREMIDEGVDAIFLTPVDSVKVLDGLETCAKAGIPVINLDSPVQNEELVECVICSDNLEAGQLCGENLLKRVWGGRVALLEDPITKTGVDRIAKFEEVIGTNPGFNIAARRDSKGLASSSEAAMKDILQKSPGIDIVMCVSDTVAMGAIAALREAGILKNVLVYGVDGSPEAKKAIKDGDMAGTSAQSPINIGQIGVDTAYQILDGKKPKKHITVPVLFISDKNIDQFFLNGWQ